MTFALVTLSVMAASIYLIYKLTNYFGFGLKYKSLLLCAVLSVAVNAVAISVSSYLDRNHYIRLAVMVLVSSALVTLYNERLCAKETQAKIMGMTFPAETQAPVPTETEERDAPIESFGQAVQASQPEALEPMPKPEQPQMTAKEPPKVQRDNAVKNVAAFGGNTTAKTGKKVNPKNPVKSATSNDELSRLDTLDSLLDYAYEQKKLNEPDKAIAAYQTALAKYSHDDYVPFIVIDLGNTYKETAAYDEAIKVYREAMTIPIIANNKATRREFANNLAYLRTVRLVLAKHRALDVPFSQIPAAYMSEIEKMFQARAAKLGLGY